MTRDRTDNVATVLQGIVLEGVTGSGKSTLLTNLQQHLALTYPACTRLALSEHYTERVLEDQKASQSLDIDSVLAHGLKLKATVESLADLRRGTKFEQRGGNATMLVTIERWLGSHVANLVEQQRPLDGRVQAQLFDLTGWLVDVGLSVVVLELSLDTLEQRLERTFAERNDEWRRYVQSLGGPAAAANRYWMWQTWLLEFYERSAIPYVRLDAGDRSNSELVDEVVALLTDTTTAATSSSS